MSCALESLQQRAHLLHTADYMSYNRRLRALNTEQTLADTHPLPFSACAPVFPLDQLLLDGQQKHNCPVAIELGTNSEFSQSRDDACSNTRFFENFANGSVRFVLILLDAASRDHPTVFVLSTRNQQYLAAVAFATSAHPSCSQSETMFVPLAFHISLVHLARLLSQL
ncbi:hypothetical protein Tcan_01589, partial [Toxocara canis]